MNYSFRVEIILKPSEGHLDEDFCQNHLKRVAGNWGLVLNTRLPGGSLTGILIINEWSSVDDRHDELKDLIAAAIEEQGLVANPGFTLTTRWLKCVKEKWWDDEIETGF